MENLTPFHLAFPVNDLNEAHKFYTEVLGCKTGRSSDQWIDFDFFGHQVVAHLKPEEVSKNNTNSVDGEDVPVRHFGVILHWEDWEALSEKLKSKNIKFIIQPQIRFKGKLGEQATMFFLDPSGNALEFKAFKDNSQIFATE
ncbi:MAG: VOC family protein [Fulvivirga sp.]|uniref:VOC family protein n=1 Tax=Fulvivirga sp. TaxID=1931237 RepID=UPI0032EF0521